MKSQSILRKAAARVVAAQVADEDAASQDDSSIVSLRHSR
jgi:hypothetical protein